jgi:putative copper export protein
VRFLHSWDALLQTTFGHLLLVKISLVALMISLSIAHDFFLGPRQRDLGRLMRQHHPGSQSAPEPFPKQVSPTRALQRLRRWTILIDQLHLVLGVLVILLAASLQLGEGSASVYGHHANTNGAGYLAMALSG